MAQTFSNDLEILLFLEPIYQALERPVRRFDPLRQKIRWLVQCQMWRGFNLANLPKNFPFAGYDESARSVLENAEEGLEPLAREISTRVHESLLSDGRDALKVLQIYKEERAVWQRDAGKVPKLVSSHTHNAFTFNDLSVEALRLWVYKWRTLPTSEDLRSAAGRLVTFLQRNGVLHRLPAGFSAVNGVVLANKDRLSKFCSKVNLQLPRGDQKL